MASIARQSGSHAMISVKPEYAQKIISGQKTIELRRRRMKLPVGGCLWFYSTLPKAGVELVAIIEEIVEASPHSIWRKFGPCTGITYGEFKRYFRQARLGIAIKLCKVEPLRTAVELEKLRTLDRNFCPPQFMKRLASDHPFIKFFRIHLLGGGSNLTSCDPF